MREMDEAEDEDRVEMGDMVCRDEVDWEDVPSGGLRVPKR
jgi:hypothetical protein